MPEQKITTHVITANKLVVYRRERSTIWQCRYKVDGHWQRATTKERDLAQAKERAHELLIEAEIRKRQNLPVVTRKFRNIAALAIKRMEEELKSGAGLASYKEYIRVTEQYLIPVLGNRSVTNIDLASLAELAQYTADQLGHAPSKSTELKHNAALSRVFDEAVIRGFLTDANRPKLETQGTTGDRRPAFELHELSAVLKNFDEWIGNARNAASRERREILRDYVEMLVDTGARPGVELLNLRWNQIKYRNNPSKRDIPAAVEENNVYDDFGPADAVTNLNRTVEMTVSGKTGTRVIIGRQPTVTALVRIARRNYGVEGSALEPLKDVAKPDNTDYVLRAKGSRLDVSSSFQKMLTDYLTEYKLLIDPVTEQKRVFYSFRHTYATLALTHDRVPIHTLAQQMGTSVLMIERHYSHLKVVNAIDQLRGEETRRLIAQTATYDEIYQSERSKKSKSNQT